MKRSIAAAAIAAMFGAQALAQTSVLKVGSASFPDYFAAADPGVADFVKAVAVPAGWGVARTDRRGVTLAPAAQKSRSEQTYRIEARRPLVQDRFSWRSAEAELRVDCNTLTVTSARYTAYAGPGLSGEAFRVPRAPEYVAPPAVPGVPPPPPPPVTGDKILQFIPASLVRAECQRDGALDAPWQVIHTKAGVTFSADRGKSLDVKSHLAMPVKVDAGTRQTESGFRWRSAKADFDVNCRARSFTADITLFSDPDQKGESRTLSGVVGGYNGQGQFYLSQGADFMRLFDNAAPVLDWCDRARERADLAAATVGTAENRAAREWAMRNLVLDNWSEPIWRVDHAYFLSNNFELTADGNVQTVIRREWVEPGASGLLSSRYVVEINCTYSRYKTLQFADFMQRNLAGQALTETGENRMRDFIMDPTLTAHFEKACERAGKAPAI